MEKMIKKMMLAGLVCLAMCGTAMAAPKGGNVPHNGRAPEQKQQVLLTTSQVRSVVRDAERIGAKVVVTNAALKREIERADYKHDNHKHETCKKDKKHKKHNKHNERCHRHDRHDCRDCRPCC